MNIVHRPIPDDHDQLVVLNSQHRLYVARSSKGDSFHVVQPTRLDDPRVGDGKVKAGDLVCCCPGALFGRVCWAVKLAQAFERGWLPDPSWLAAPESVPTLQEVTVP